MGPKVQEYERAMAKLCDVRHAVFVSSGSTANTILAMRVRDTCPKERNVVVLPVLTWQTSCAPWIREGFKPVFIGISVSTLGMNLNLLERYLQSNASQVACVFVTSLLGFCPDINELARMSRQYGVTIMLDNCESALSTFAGKNISSYFTSTTSTYFSHHLQSVEGGFVLTNDDDMMEYAIMARNHGMTRGTSFNGSNPHVDPMFEFQVMGSNFRNTDINAAIGLLDLKRVQLYTQARVDAFDVFRSEIDQCKYIVPRDGHGCLEVPFAIPIVTSSTTPSLKSVRAVCDSLSIESRPVISGNLLRHSAYKAVNTGITGHPIFDCAVADHVHRHGLYVGLGAHVTPRMVSGLCEQLNDL
jgi:CDP-6-deoxy-D-xylo-4-hexulose-3-dehydrase